MRIYVAYTLTLAEVNHRTGVTEHTVNLGNFYPVLCVWEAGSGFRECVYAANGDPFYSACADYAGDADRARVIHRRRVGGDRGCRGERRAQAVRDDA